MTDFILSNEVSAYTYVQGCCCMKKSLVFWQTVGFVFTSIVGTLLHFLYNWSGQNFVVGLFSAVNESIWEHMKLLYVPMLVFALFERRYIKSNNYWCAKLIGIVTGLMLIPVLYYTYTGALGLSKDWVNIAIFFISVFITYFLETKLIKSEKEFCFSQTACVFVFISIGVIFVALTISPLNIPLFLPPD